MSILSTPESEMGEAERTMADYINMRLKQVDRGRDVMRKRIENINSEQEDLKIRAEEVNKMVDDERASSDGEITKSGSDWYIDTANEITTETNKLGSRLEGAKKLVKQINDMQNVYINVAKSVDSGEMSLVEAKNILLKAEQKCEWLSDNHEYDLSVVDNT